MLIYISYLLTPSVSHMWIFMILDLSILLSMQDRKRVKNWKKKIFENLWDMQSKIISTFSNCTLGEDSPCLGT